MFTAKPNLPEKHVSYRYTGYKRAFLLQLSKKNLKIECLKRCFTSWVIRSTCVIVMISPASCITAAALKMWTENQINSVDTARYYWRMNWKNYRSHLKKVFCSNLCVGSSFQLLGILEVCLRVEPRSRLDLEPKSNFWDGFYKRWRKILLILGLRLRRVFRKTPRPLS